jgi:hypothetical protein
MVWYTLHAWLVDQDMEYLVDDPGVQFYLLAASAGQRSRYWGTQRNWENRIQFKLEFRYKTSECNRNETPYLFCM